MPSKRSPNNPTKHVPNERQVQGLLAALKLQPKTVESAAKVYLGFSRVTPVAKKYLEDMESKGLIWLERGTISGASEVILTVYLEKPEPKQTPNRLQVVSESRPKVRFDEGVLDLGAVPDWAKPKLAVLSQYLLRAIIAMFVYEPNKTVASTQIYKQYGSGFDGEGIAKTIDVLLEVGMIQRISKNPATYRWVWRSGIKEQRSA